MERLSDYYNHYESEWERCFSDDVTVSDFIDTMANHPMLCRAYVEGESPANAVMLVRNELRRGIVIYSSVLGIEGITRLIGVSYQTFFESLFLTTVRLPVLLSALHDDVEQVSAAVFILVCCFGEFLYPANIKARKQFISNSLYEMDLTDAVLSGAIARLHSHPQRPKQIH